MENSESPQVHMEDLNPMNLQLGIMHQIVDVQTQKAIMDGHFSFNYHHNGLSIHCVRAKELQNISTSLELQPGLSFNLIFKGQVNFSLAGQTYQLGHSNLQKVECTAISIQRPEILTRYMQQDMEVHKVNLYVQRSWLEQHCKMPQHLQQIEQLFQNHAKVHSWSASKSLIKKANAFFTLPQQDLLTSQLNSEYQAIQLLSSCLQDLGGILDWQTPLTEKPQLLNQPQPQLKQRIDDRLSEYRSLDDIAASLGYSVSTLQRRFKRSYHMTVIEYIRQRRLEMARAALTIEGLSIGEAAYLAGYKHPSNFVAAFKKRFAITPSGLIKAHRMENG